MGHPSSDIEVFNPNDACLSEKDSVVISVETVTSYLDTALKALSLHTKGSNLFHNVRQSHYMIIESPDLPSFNSATGFLKC